MTPIHPKTSAAALGGALGVVIVSVLESIHGVNLSAEACAAIPTFLSTLGAFVVPSPDAVAPVVAQSASGLPHVTPSSVPIPAAVIPVRPVDPGVPPAA